MGFNATTGKVTGIDLLDTTSPVNLGTLNTKVPYGSFANPAISFNPLAPPAPVKQDLVAQATNESKGVAKPLKTITVTPINSQPTEPPSIGFDSTSLEADSYREGNPDLGGEYSESRTLGEPTEERLASITLSANASGDTLINAYTRFFLQSVMEAEQEKYQVVETFTGYYAFFYGKRPPIYRYSGLLLADDNHNWNNEFKFVYENYFRGTKAAEYNAQVLLVYDRRLVTGFPLSLTMQQDAISPKGMPFSMDLLVVDHVPINFSDDINALLQAARDNLTLQQQNILMSLGTDQASTAAILGVTQVVGGPDAPADAIQSASADVLSMNPTSGRQLIG